MLIFYYAIGHEAPERQETDCLNWQFSVFFHSETLSAHRTLLLSIQELEKISCLFRDNIVARGRTTQIKDSQFK